MTSPGARAPPGSGARLRALLERGRARGAAGSRGEPRAWLAGRSALGWVLPADSVCVAGAPGSGDSRHSLPPLALTRSPPPPRRPNPPARRPEWR